MLARITPHELSGTLPAIASKSMAHRLVILAALADRSTLVRCNTTCADIDATVRCLNALGARVTPVRGGFDVRPVRRELTLQGMVFRTRRGAVLDCGESGSTLRFMLPVAAALGADAFFTGAQRLVERPLKPLVKELRAHGASITAHRGFPIACAGKLQPARYEIPGNVSSQFVTGLMLAAPALGRPVEVAVTGELESRPYVDVTIRALRAFGIEVAERRTVAEDGEPLTVFSLNGAACASPRTVGVEGDWSNAAFWLCAGALGSEPVAVSGLDLASPQGDRAIMGALLRFGARVRRGSGLARVQPDKLRGYTLSAADIPDLVPTLAAVAALAEGETRITDCARLRMKESDRLATVAETVNRLGGNARAEGDDLVVTGVERLKGGTVSSHNDHRIAMMAAVAAVRAEGPVTIEGAEAVRKSYPGFFDDYRLLGGEVELLSNDGSPLAPDGARTPAPRTVPDPAAPVAPIA